MTALTRSLRNGLFAAAALVALSAPPVLAQEEPSASHLTAARQAIAAIDATDQFDSVLMNAATQIKGELIMNNPDRTDELSDMVDEAAIELAPRRAVLENEIARIYAQLFTEEELTAIAQFYASPAGQKLIQQGPLANRETVAAAEIWANALVRDLRAAADQGAREIIPAASATPATPPAQ